MYYKSINRGLSFTKPGFYAIGYVMAVGLLAIISGVNGLYLFLSAGLALLIVSGLLSERVMRFGKVRELNKVTSDAETPFTVDFTVENRSRAFTIYGIDTYFLFDRPRVKILSADIAAPIKGTAIRIMPGETISSRAECTGLPRGRYEKIVAYQKTSYPFGFLEKYRFADVTCDLVITPKVDAELLERLTRELMAYRALRDQVQDFYSHRNYNAQDSLRHIDWKKSASRPQKDWVVRIFRADEHVHRATVSIDARMLATCTSPDAYEALLRSARTALQAFLLAGFVVSLDISGHGGANRDAQMIWLASFPNFDQRSKISEFLKTIEENDFDHEGLVCVIGSGGYSLGPAKKKAA